MTLPDTWQELLSQPLWVAYQIQGGRFEYVKFCPAHGTFWEFSGIGDDAMECARWPNNERSELCADASWEVCFGLSDIDVPLLRKTRDYDKETMKQLLEATKQRRWEKIEVTNE